MDIFFLKKRGASFTFTPSPSRQVKTAQKEKDKENTQGATGQLCAAPFLIVHLKYWVDLSG